MIYFSGDIHGSPWGIQTFCQKAGLTKDDILVLLGDVGANYYGGWRDDEMKAVLAALAPTILCIHGNHEMRPQVVDDYHAAEWNGGKVWLQDRFPNLLFAQDGEIFTLNGLNYIVIGGLTAWTNTTALPEGTTGGQTSSRPRRSRHTLKSSSGRMRSMWFSPTPARTNMSRGKCSCLWSIRAA